MSFKSSVLTAGLAAIVVAGLAAWLVYAKERRPPPQPGTRWTDEQLVQAVAPMRAGRRLTPERWPNGAKVAVCLSWDVDAETLELVSGNTAPVALSEGEYAAIQALPRILDLHARHDVPGTFYIPAVSALLHPEIVEALRRRPQHEVGIHGWIHERLPRLGARAEEEHLLRRALDFWTRALGQRPVGYRAPYFELSEHTLDLLREAGFAYDSSAMSRDEPYELLARGRPTGLVELPVSWILDDAAYLAMPRGALSSPRLVFEIYRDEFDGAYREGTLFMLTLHPEISGHRSRLVHIERLIAYIKAKPHVWFATGRQIAEYVRQQNGMVE